VARKYPLVSAAWFWSINSINAVADKGIDQQTIADVTKKVNGGYNGLADRQTQTLKYWNILNGQIPH
jgi:putative chitinase